ncbi:hypothetical protein NKR19_g2121 [Coniochaeta hoffmannii]|uniref:Uncharacterized protein n=1 Tax=Coniochaeta hoffmannii TaxID=91930 RepID=A0AA38RZB8_9PEZI|nr:hypothetical protein NKR19_g2121 [Coniochaeta hoffmannii]
MKPGLCTVSVRQIRTATTFDVRTSIHTRRLDDIKGTLAAMTEILKSIRMDIDRCRDIINTTETNLKVHRARNEADLKLYQESTKTYLTKLMATFVTAFTTIFLAIEALLHSNLIPGLSSQRQTSPLLVQNFPMQPSSYGTTHHSKQEDLDSHEEQTVGFWENTWAWGQKRSRSS